jgi:hypothetical protein
MAGRPDRPETERLCREVGEILANRVCPPGVGFALLLFTFEPGWTTYCANAQREDMIRELRDLADRLERGEG